MVAEAACSTLSRASRGRKNGKKVAKGHLEGAGERVEVPPKQPRWLSAEFEWGAEVDEMGEFTPFDFKILPLCNPFLEEEDPP